MSARKVFKTRPHISKRYETIHDFCTENLIVSGCSFTYNCSEEEPTSWPYYLRDFGGFKNVLDCSLVGAGNSHISSALIWGLENDQPPADNSLIVVMWSGNDRDDFICPSSIIKTDTRAKFYYTDEVMTARTGGCHSKITTNTIYNNSIKEFTMSKNNASRAVENYIYFTTTWHYLTSRGYKFVFLNFLDSSIPSVTQHFNIKNYLPKQLSINVDRMFLNITDLYTWSVNNNLLSDDNYHPGPGSHITWTRQVLLPKLRKTFSVNTNGILERTRDVFFNNIFKRLNL
jgi:hypothetical protein